LSDKRAIVEEAAYDTVARCKKQTGDVYASVYLGTQRAPAHADEHGAVAVIECVFGGRVRVYPIAGDPDHRRVEYDRDWTAP
jgi:hypothetical protein